MRRRAWAAWALVALALGLGFAGAATDVEALNVLAGLCWIAAAVLGVALLPFWPRVLPQVPPMPGLFTRPLEGQRWCASCGSPADEDAPCGVCGAAPKAPRRRRDRTQS